MADKPKIDLVVEKYVQLRDKKEKMTSDFKKSLEPITDAMERLENYLLKHLNDTGLESAKTVAGTAFLKTTTSATVADWDLTLRFIQQHQRWDMLEKRVAKSAIEQYKGEHEDIPPGVRWTEIRGVQVRRA